MAGRRDFAVLLLLVNVVTAGGVELTADCSKKASNLTTFWNGGGWDNEQVVDTESEQHNWMFDIDPKNTQCIYQQEQNDRGYMSNWRDQTVYNIWRDMGSPADPLTRRCSD